MKTLLLLRHGKSDWAADYAGDHERPLKGRGRRDAARVGRFLAAYGPPPDRCLTSTAVRARTTLRLAHEAGGWRAPVEETAELYHAYPETVLSVLARVDDGVGTLLVTGHEPTLSETVARLVAPRSGGAVEMPTAALACIDLDVDRWADVTWGSGALRWLVTPAALKEALAAEGKASGEGSRGGASGG